MLGRLDKDSRLKSEFSATGTTENFLDPQLTFRVAREFSISSSHFPETYGVPESAGAAFSATGNVVIKLPGVTPQAMNLLAEILIQIRMQQLLMSGLSRSARDYGRAQIDALRRRLPVQLVRQRPHPS